MNGNPAFVLQRINHRVFPNVEGLQANILAVTRHLRSLDCNPRHVLEFLSTSGGLSYVYEDGRYWRMSRVICNGVSPVNVNGALAYDCGKAFMKFIRDLGDFGGELVVTIPHFHDIEFRLGQLASVRGCVEEGQDAQRVLRLLEEVDARVGALGVVPALPKRVCHGDTKHNNVLVDADTGEFLCVIDLDTVMEDYVMSDFGDFLRTAANPAGEETQRLEEVRFDIDVFKAFSRGFLEAGVGFLEEREVDSLVFGAKLFPYMQAIRFLWDFLQGNTYYRIEYSGQNLMRAEVQMQLLKSIESVEGELRTFIANFWQEAQHSARLTL